MVLKFSSESINFFFCLFLKFLIHIAELKIDFYSLEEEIKPNFILPEALQGSEKYLYPSGRQIRYIY